MTGFGTVLGAVGAIGCGVVGGVFLGFSTIVMPALARLAPSAGIAAMQAINVTAVRPVFMTALFGSAVVCLAAVIPVVRQPWSAATALTVAAAGLYLVGTIGVTVGYHVPRNDALAALDPMATTSVDAWTRYLREWTAANHLRAVAAIAAAAAFAAALIVDRS